MPIKDPTVVALGNFDGLHLGHRRLVEEAVGLGNTNGWISTVWSFATHPALLLGRPHPGLLMQSERKSSLLRQMGVKQEILADFALLRDCSPEEFIENVLLGELNAVHVVCGFNYTFGKQAAGTLDLLRERLQRAKVGISVISPVSFEGEPVSSSRIRRLLQEGALSSANAMLGTPLTLEGRVTQGKQLGRELGVPTANLVLPNEFVKLRHGVYATRIHWNGKRYAAVTNVGLRPTVEGQAAPNCESYLFDFSGDLYGSSLQCEFLEFIRPEQRFSSLEALKKQIHCDVNEVKRYFESHH